MSDSKMRAEFLKKNNYMIGPVIVLVLAAIGLASIVVWFGFSVGKDAGRKEAIAEVQAQITSLEQQKDMSEDYNSSLLGLLEKAVTRPSEDSSDSLDPLEGELP